MSKKKEEAADATTVVQEMQDIAASNGQEAKPRKAPRLTPKDIQILARVDRLLTEADASSPGASWRVIYFIAHGRGWTIQDFIPEERGGTA